MSISTVGSATNSLVNHVASDGDSAAAEAAESKATKQAEKMNGGVAPKATAVPASTSNTTSSTNDLSKLRMLANKHMSASAIAMQLGKSVSAVMQEAAAAGINLNSESSSDTTYKQAVGIGTNVDTQA